MIEHEGFDEIDHVPAPLASSVDARPQRAQDDSGSWAQPVRRLATADGLAPLDTVRGRRVVGALQGFGKLWQKTYRLRLASCPVDARGVVSTWKEHFSELWPEGNTFYAPLTGIKPGEVALLQVGVLGSLRLSTGVAVIYVDDESFTFMTPEGHMFAGWITFSATDEPDGPVAQVQVLMRAQHPISELGLALWGHRQEDRFWQATLTALGRRFTPEVEAVSTTVVCVDSRRQWRRATNIRHDATVRSALFAAAAPVRWLRKAARGR